MIRFAILFVARRGASRYHSRIVCLHIDRVKEGEATLNEMPSAFVVGTGIV